MLEAATDCLIVEHDSDEDRAPTVFLVPLQIFIIVVHCLRHRRIVDLRIADGNAPPYDPLVFFHEDQSVLAQTPVFWSNDPIVALIESLLTTSDRIEFAQRGG